MNDGIIVLPDGSACTTAPLPSPNSHWLVKRPATDHE